MPPTNKKIRIAVTVISDLVTDQRVHKVCQSLHEAGYDVVLIGAARRYSLAISTRGYHVKRIRLLFQKKMGLYAEVNIRFFFLLLFRRADILLGNDLDVMPATYLASVLKRKPVVYDTHEYYLGMPELNGRPFVKSVWRRIERFIFPRLKYIYTICDSFCGLYKKDYGKTLQTVRNVPYLQLNQADVSVKEDFILTIDQQKAAGKKIILFQGVGINPDRGGEELVQAMQYIDPKQYHLLIIGGGLLFDTIKNMVKDLQLSDRITIAPRVPFEMLRYITGKADLGLSLDKPNNINHIYGLPNKIFDYLHAGVPVLVSRLIELEKIVTQYDVGMFIENHDPKHIAERIKDALSNGQRLERWKQHTVTVRNDCNWEKESKTVIDIFKQVAASRV